MTEAKSIAEELGEFKTDEQWLQAEIARLNKSSIVPLEHVRDLHGWLDEKRKARQSCRLVGESRTGKTVACEAYTLRNKPKQEGQQTPIVPVVYIMPPSKCGAKDLFKEIIEYLRYRLIEQQTQHRLRLSVRSNAVLAFRRHRLSFIN